MPAIIQNLKKIWARMNGAQRALMIGVIALCVGGMIAAAFWGGSPSFRLLRGNLDRETASKALTRLDEAGIRYRLENDGREIMVDVRDFERAQTVAVQQQLFPVDGDLLGYRGITNMSFGLTEEQQKLRVRIAQEEEIARSLKQFEGVDSVKVHLVPSERGFSRKDALPAKASVVIKTKPGHVFDPSTVEAMTLVVANAAPGLTRSNVVITDTRGTALSVPGRDSDGAGMLTQARAREIYLANKAQSALDAALGPNHAVVRVDAVVESETTDNTTSAIKPDSKVTMSEKVTNSADGGGSKPAGPVGTRAETEGATAASSGGKSEEIESKFEYTRETTHTTTERIGIVKRLTVSVLLDKSFEASQDQVKGIVKGAVGFDEARKDYIELAVVPFAEPPKPVEPAAPGGIAGLELPSVIEMIKWGVTGIASIIIGLMVLKSVKAARATMRTAFEDAQSEPKEESRRSDPTVEISQVIDRDAQAVSKLLRNWLYETAKG